MKNLNPFRESHTFLTGFATVALGILLAIDGLANESPKYKGPLVDQTNISRATKQKLLDIHILLNAKTYNSRTLEILKAEAGSGQIGSDAGREDPFDGLEKISDSFKRRYNNLLPDQKNKVLFRIGEAQNRFKIKNQFKRYSEYKILNSDMINNEKLNDENITKLAERWIMYYFGINQRNQYIKQNGNVGKDFETGEGAESILDEIKAIYPESITQNDLIKAKESDSSFAKEKNKKADEQRKADEEGIRKAKEFDRSFVKEGTKKTKEEQRKADEEGIKKAKELDSAFIKEGIKKADEEQRKTNEKNKKVKEERRKADEEGIKKADEQRRNAKNIFEIGTKVTK